MGGLATIRRFQKKLPHGPLLKATCLRLAQQLTSTNGAGVIKSVPSRHTSTYVDPSEHAYLTLNLISGQLACMSFIWRF